MVLSYILFNFPCVCLQYWHCICMATNDLDHKSSCRSVQLGMYLWVTFSLLIEIFQAINAAATQFQLGNVYNVLIQYGWLVNFHQANGIWAIADTKWVHCDSLCLHCFFPITVKKSPILCEYIVNISKVEWAEVAFIIKIYLVFLYLAEEKNAHTVCEVLQVKYNWPARQWWSPNLYECIMEIPTWNSWRPVHFEGVGKSWQFRTYTKNKT